MQVSAVDTREGASDSEQIEEGGAEVHDIAPGTSIEDRAAAGEHEEPEDDGTHQLVVPGTGPGLTTQVGGKRPGESLFKMGSVALPIAGGVELKKDTELWVAVPVAIDEVAVRNRRKDGQIVATARVHKATAIGQPIVMEGPPPGVE